ncbi:hypothetical protein F5J12DRAFT_797692 [Pisolithus orientalis]|uniref:uncharacterized protein n=1 Tax=Pisolithus orientalis TaxID=936130 RepID=UPI0022256F19|nr:uncharacterized protein F5J12DRAFT_797692 [Pisolithus orientalis]KAI6032950.1 hypothetical protein F5J12DRAFT_797692 [Pisolithus orientalis]
MSWKEAFEKGIASFQGGELSEALLCMNQAIELQGDNFRIYDSRAAIHEKLGNLKAALLDSKKVIDLAPTQWQGYTRATRIFISLEKHDSATKMVDLALTRLQGDDSKHRGKLLELREKSVQAQVVVAKKRQLRLAKVAYHVGKLPIEILTEIFAILVDADPCQAVRLSRVCGHWRRVIVGTPIFWRTLVLSNRHPVRKIKTWLERSGSRIASLSVRRALSPSEFPTILAHLRSLSWSYIEALHAHSSFFSELSQLLSGMSMTHLFSNLKQLSLESCGTVDFTHPPTREWKLRELSLVGTTQFPESHWRYLTQLRALHIRQLPTHFPLSIIEAIPLVESLVLDFSTSLKILGTIDKPLQMIQLKSIELRNAENPLGLLENIDAPFLTDLTIFGAVSRVDEALLHVFRDERDSLVSLRLGSCSLNSGTLISILSCVPCLETLQIYCIDGVVNETLRFLAGRDPLSPSQATAQQRLLCPALKHVDVSRCPDLLTSSAFALVKSRLQNELGADSEAESCPLQSLRTDGCLKMDGDILQWFRLKVPYFSCVYMTKKEARQRH